MALPPAGYLSDPARTESEMKTALEDQRDAIAALEATAPVPGPAGPAGPPGPVGPAGVAPTGTILAFAGPTPPAGFLACQGQLISRTGYADLFAVLGTTYGAGDGSTTFAVPDLRGRALRGFDATQVEFSPLGKTGGEKAHVLTVAELAAHGHGVNDPGHAHQMRGANNAAGAGPTGLMAPGVNAAANDVGANVAAYTGLSVQSVGSSAAHNTLGPYLVVTFVIKT